MVFGLREAGKQAKRAKERLRDTLKVTQLVRNRKRT